MPKPLRAAASWSRSGKLAQLAHFGQAWSAEADFQLIQRPPFTSLLVLAPHPDDESIGAGGLITASKAADIPVHVVWLTNGDRGGDSTVRQREAVAAGRELGLAEPEMEFLGGQEGQLDRLQSKLEDVLCTIKPQAIALPGFWDNQPDHRSANQLALSACQTVRYEPFVWAYEIWTPFLINRLFDITEFWPQKAKAIAAHQSQLKQRDYIGMAEGLNRYRAATQGLDGVAEGFVVLPFRQYADLAQIS